MGACRARQLASVEVLLSDKRLNVNLGSAFTPLYLVSRLGYADIAALLIAHPDIEVNADKLGCIPLKAAIEAKQDAIVVSLASHPKIQVTNQLLGDCIQQKLTEGTRVLVEAEGLKVSTFELQKALDTQNAEIVATILNCGVDSDSFDEQPKYKDILEHAKQIQSQKIKSARKD